MSLSRLKRRQKQQKEKYNHKKGTLTTIIAFLSGAIIVLIVFILLIVNDNEEQVLEEKEKSLEHVQNKENETQEFIRSHNNIKTEEIEEEEGEQTISSPHNSYPYAVDIESMIDIHYYFVPKNNEHYETSNIELTLLSKSTGVFKHKTDTVDERGGISSVTEEYQVSLNNIPTKNIQILGNNSDSHRIVHVNTELVLGDRLLIDGNQYINRDYPYQTGPLYLFYAFYAADGTLSLALKDPRGYMSNTQYYTVLYRIF